MLKKVTYQKIHPQKFNLHNIKLYDFYLNMIHFILDFYNKYLVERQNEKNFTFSVSNRRKCIANLHTQPMHFG